MYDRSDSTTTGQVFDFIHHGKNRFLFGLNFILPVAELKNNNNKQDNQVLQCDLRGTLLMFICKI